MNSYLASGLLLVGILALPNGSALLGLAQTTPQVPPEFQALYSTLKSSLDNFNANLTALSSKSGLPIFGSELLPANSNRGDALLAPNAMQSVALYLDRLRELGVGGVTFPVGYPLYTPSFPNYQNYVQFYKQVVEEVRKRGMIVDIESSVLFANSAFSAITFDYSKLAFQQFEMQRRQMISAIIQDLQPDYLNLGAEPDTQYKLTGYKEFRSTQSYTAYVNYILDGLNRGKTKLGAGSGTWIDAQYVQSLATSTNLDFIALHVYPVVGPTLTRILTFADFARQHGKRVILDEAWLSKIGTLQSMTIDANTDVFRNDAFSFWAPLDQKFLSTMVSAARVAGIEYVSPFWTMQFFGYLDYTSATTTLSYRDITAALNSVASKNLLSDQFSSTGLFYKQLTGSISTSSTMPPTTQPTYTTTSFTSRPNGIGLGLIAALIVAAGIVAAGALWRRR